jgi:hypothetical protein
MERVNAQYKPAKSRSLVARLLPCLQTDNDDLRLFGRVRWGHPVAGQVAHSFAGWPGRVSARVFGSPHGPHP